MDRRRRRRLKEISGELKPGYFRLAPREEEEGFTRADNKHEEVLRWLKNTREPVLYLTGQSGSGKSSILSAWVIPRLSKEDPRVKVIPLRGYEDPLSTLTSKLREPGVIWIAPPKYRMLDSCSRASVGEFGDFSSSLTSSKSSSFFMAKCNDEPFNNFSPRWCRTPLRD